MPRPTAAASKPPAIEQPHVLVLGLGFTGRKFASACLAQGWKVTGTSRDTDVIAPRVGNNVACLLGPDDSAEALDAAIEQATHILATAPVERSTGQDPFVRLHGHALGRAAVNGCVKWAGYLSTTSVYGNHDGAWVDETTPTQPTLKRGVLRVDAERTWRATGLPIHIFRLPGIYGPGRGPLPRARAGTARSIVKDGQMFSRIHVDDIVGTLLASISTPNPGRIYNVCDNEPAATHEVTEFCCSMLGVPAPERVAFETATNLSAMATTFYQDNKMVSNARIKEELKVVLLYPTYREGLRAQLQQELDLENSSRVVALQHTLDQLRYVARASVFGTVHVVQSNASYILSLLFGTANGLCCYMKRLLVGLFRTTEFTPLQKTTMPLSYEFILVDNGSLRPEPTIQLRKLANKLSGTLTESVVAVSARHSNKIDPALLGGTPARILTDFVKDKVGQLSATDETATNHSIVALPMFLGPSDTVTKYTPSMLAKLVASCAQLTKHVNWCARVAPVLFDPSVTYFPTLSTRMEEPSPSLAAIMMKMINQTRASRGLSAPLRVVLVDHGSPNIKVNHVRRGLAAQLRQLLCANDPLACVLDVSMERRPGKEYDFNEPLLENVFEATPGWETGDVIVVFAFLCPGRHAGPGGDLAEILEDVQRRHAGIRLHPTGLLADDDNLDALAELLVANARSVTRTMSTI